MFPADGLEFYPDRGPWFLPVQGMAVALTALIPLLPAEFMVIASGAMASRGELSLAGAFSSTFIGCLGGDIGLYALFRYKFIRVLYRWKWGRNLHRRLLRIAVRAGGPSTWAGLLLVYAMPFGRSAAMVTAGMVQMRWRGVVTLATTGGALWSWWLIALGYVPTAATELPAWLSTIIGIALGTGAGIVVAYIGARGRHKQRVPPTPTSRA